MKNILSEIYHGSYDVLKRKDRKGTAFAATLNRMNELEAEIRKALPDEAKEAFENYIQAQADLAELACEEDFISGYQLGVAQICNDGAKRFLVPEVNSGSTDSTLL